MYLLNKLKPTIKVYTAPTMAFKFAVLSLLVAAANAGFIGAPVAAPVAYAASPYAATPYAHGVAAPAIVSQQNNILRTPGNLGQVSTYSKTISTPYSSVSKYDTRVSNDALAYSHGYAAPAYAAPAPLAYAAPAAYATPSVAAHGSLLGVAYSAAPVVAHMTYSNGYGINYAY